MKFRCSEDMKLAVVIVVCVWTHVLAGTCWERYNKTAGRCFGLISIDTKEECCDMERGSFFRAKNLSVKQMFFQFSDGVTDCVPCASLLNPKNQTDLCKGVTCPRGKICKVKGHRRTKCICRKRRCNRKEKSKGPLCGSDGRTYKNKCALSRRACREGRTISVAYRGQCRNSCDTVVCLSLRDGQKQSCLVDKRNRAHCVSCENVCVGQGQLGGGEVCGEDGVTYQNRCKLRMATCRRGRSIGIAYYGKCGQKNCSSVKCLADQKCVPDKKGNPQCVTCSCKSNFRNFRPERDLVCGTDDQTYKGQCAMDQQSCKTGKLIEVKNYGTCKQVLNKFFNNAGQKLPSGAPSPLSTSANGTIQELLKALEARGESIRYRSFSDTPMEINVKEAMRKILNRLQRKKKPKSRIPLKDSNT